MSTRRIVVLKFGGSVLREVADTARIAQEIYRWRRDGWLVVAVVSAVGNTTDRLVQRASEFDTEPDPHKFAALLATGERQSAALTGLALDRAGLESFVADEVRLGIVTDGDPLDSSPVSLDAQELLSLLDSRGVVVVPGFIGRDRSGNVTLLGRGGSDLTALFIAARIGAARCRLVKDVPGLFEFDPKIVSASPPRLYAEIPFDEALQLDECIVQHKGIRLAREVSLDFEVGALFCDEVTSVGSRAISRFRHRPHSFRKARVAIFGAGNVGLGVWHWLSRFGGDRFEVVSVCARNREKAIASGIPEELFTTDPNLAISGDCDIAVELIGGTDPARSIVESSLGKGCHVVTANKTLLAGHGNKLDETARNRNVSLAGSAAVGGCVPVLEAVRAAVNAGKRIVSLRGILNGTSNQVLELVCSGYPLDLAIESAQLAGLAEADPGRDLAGLDAAEKLLLIARQSGVEIPLSEISLQGIDESIVERVRSESRVEGERILKQVVEWRPESGKAPSASLQWLSASDRLAGVQGAGNGVEVIFDDGQSVFLEGKGAGRWATTTAVIADLIDIAQRLNDVAPKNTGASALIGQG
jgi:homoserine dehydrogenase